MGNLPIIYFRVVDPGRSSLWRPRQRPAVYEVSIDGAEPKTVDFKGLLATVALGRGNNDLYAADSIAKTLYTDGNFDSWVNYPSLGTERQIITDLKRALQTWHPYDPGQRELKEEYAAFLATGGPGALDRDAGSEHMTASSFIFTDDLAQVLLCFHRKGQFWVQLGGHIDPEDATAAMAATREATEESGLAGLTLLSVQPIDVNRHALANAFGACKVHWDLGYGFMASRLDNIVVSPESEDVAWWPVDQLPERVPHDFPERLRLALAELKVRLERS